MIVHALWFCSTCDYSNGTTMDSAKAQNYDLVCEACRQSQHKRLTLVNFVKEEEKTHA